MKDFAIYTKNNTVRILNNTYTIDDFKNRCIKFHENRDLDDAITYGEVETLIRLGFIDVQFHSKGDPILPELDADEFDYTNCEYTTIWYTDSTTEQLIGAYTGAHCPVTSMEVIETIYMNGDHLPQAVHKVLCTICDALDELRA